jgi:HEAT repeats
VLEGLGAVNWAALGHAYGSAEDVPWLLRHVRSADAKVREDALHELCFTIVHQGTRYSATAPAVPFLVELATAPDTHNRPRLVNLLAYAAVGLDEASLPDGIVTLDQLRHTTTTPGREHKYGPWALAAYQAVQAALPVLLPLLEEADDRLRRETAHLLAWFPSFAPASLPRLRARLDLETERDTRATMIVAIGLLAGATGQRSDTPWLSALLAGPDPILRWAAATALARLFPEHPPEPAVQELLGWLTDQPDANPFTLHANAFPSHDDLPFGQYTLQTLVRPGPAARARVAEALLARLQGASGGPAEALLWDLMVVAFEGDPQAPRPPFAGLNPLQQRIVGALIRMPWIWRAEPGGYVPADNPLWAYGLPNTQQGLRTYASDVRLK